MLQTEQIHATCVAIDGCGVLIRGPSGSGKSDLALRLIDQGAQLVADDRVDLNMIDGKLHASAPARLRGLIEARGVGIMRIEALAKARLYLVVDLVAQSDVERLPETTTMELIGNPIRTIQLNAFDVSAPAKIRLVVRAEPDAMVEPTCQIT